MRPEYGAGPLWDDEWDGVADICADPASLGVSNDLAADLRAWQAAYDATLNGPDPLNSGFADQEACTAWESRGRALFSRLQVELGESAVVRLDLAGVANVRASVTIAEPSADHE